MKETNAKEIRGESVGMELALNMYKETVSPSRATLINILNQIPEKENLKKDGRAIRSPYIWLAITQAVAVLSILFVLLPSLSGIYNYGNDPFYSVDKQVENFENKINAEDAAQIVLDYNNHNL